MNDEMRKADMFHGHDHQMWDYCIYLGPYTGKDGGGYDLGVYVGNRDGWVSLAAVYGPEDSQYRSGELGHSIGSEKEYLEYRSTHSAICKEALSRYREYLVRNGGGS